MHSFFLALSRVWGSLRFEPEKFKAANEKDRLAMAADAVERKVFVGESMWKVQDALGEPDSYFFSDSIFAYGLSEFAKENIVDQTKETWDLVFVPDKDLKNVADVKIHKRCCYKMPAWAK